MSDELEETPNRECMPKNVSNNSFLLGEEIPSREGSPVGDKAPNSTEAPADEIPGPPSCAEDIPAVKSGDSGKPPRAPSSYLLPMPRPSPPSRNSSAGHSRKQSLDDLSALTDDAGGEAIDLSFRQHQNSVSWDKGVNIVQDAGVAMPMFGETIDTSKPVPPMSPTTAATPTTRAKRHWGKIKAAVVSSNEENINLRTVNPLETEAEAAILRALDSTRRKNALQGANILPHVSDEAAAVFKKDATPEQSNVSHSRKPSGADEPSIVSGRTAVSAANTKKAHKRNETLDNKLFDLANQMTMIQGGDFPEGEGGRERTFTADSGVGNRGRLFSGEDVGATTEYKGSSGDVLVQNAAALFRRPLAAKRQTSVATSEGSSQHQLDVSSGGVGGRRSSISQNSGGSYKKHDDVIMEGGESDESEIDVEIGVGVTTDTEEVESARDGKRKGFGFRPGKIAKATNDEVKEDFETFRRFLQPRTGVIKFYLLFLVGCIIVPGLVVATILYHVAGNPGLGREGASTSWFILFLVRQVITGTLAQCTQVFIIDFLSLQLRLTVRLFGTMFTLLLVQSKGWPCLIFFWGVFNFAMNSGRNPFAAHWLFWQDLVPVFNAKNPSGTIAYSRVNYAINGLAVTLGFVVALKRLWWGLYLGRRTYRHYGDEVAKVIKQMLMISQVAHWGKEIERHGRYALTKRGFSSTATREILSSYHITEDEEQSAEDDGDVVDLADHLAERTGKVLDEDRMNKLTGTVTSSQKMKLDELLGRWEEPEVVGEHDANISIASILQFRQMLAYMDEDYPFSVPFGHADTRETCVESAQNLYSRLMLLNPDEPVLPFDTLAVLAKDKDGEIKVDEMKDLIRLFRPDRNGDLTCLDFVKSCDEVYKEMRMLRASIANSGQVDHAFEILVNIIFYLIVGIVVLVVLHLDPLALFVSVSGIILAFAFMIGSASAKYFEGILFILVRRPYDIGDRIALSNPETPLSIDGSATWFVQTVGLFTTTVRFAATNEVATLANGSLAASRVINAKRSPQANVYVFNKFSVHVPYSKVMIFKKCVESFVKERPREWIALNGFRATRVEQDAGFIEYITCLGHRNSWQDIGPILQSKADVASYCLELAKKLGMRYTAPPLPVNLSMADQSNFQVVKADKPFDAFHESAGPASPTPSQSTNTPASPDVRALSALFKTAV